MSNFFNLLIYKGIMIIEKGYIPFKFTKLDNKVGKSGPVLQKPLRPSHSQSSNMATPFEKPTHL